MIYDKEIGRLRLSLDSSGGSRVELTYLDGYNDQCPKRTARLDREELLDLKYMIDGLLGRMEDRAKGRI